MIGNTRPLTQGGTAALNEIPSQLMSLIDRANNSLDLAQSTQGYLVSKLSQLMRPAYVEADCAVKDDVASVELSPFEYQLSNIIARIDAISELNQTIVGRLPL